MAAHQTPPSLGFSRQEHWSGLPFPSPMHESEKWKWSRSFVSNPQRPHGLQPSRLLCPWDFPGKSTEVGCLAFSGKIHLLLTFCKNKRNKCMIRKHFWKLQRRDAMYIPQENSSTAHQTSAMHVSYTQHVLPDAASYKTAELRVLGRI